MFLKRNGIKHLTSAPYHPASNSLAERCVQSFKSAMESETEVKPLNIKLATFLLAYRNTPPFNHWRSAISASLGRWLRTRMDLLKPDLHLKISNLQIDETVTKSGAIIREFFIGQTVIARNYPGSTKRVPDIIRTQLGPFSYEVEVKPGLVWPNRRIPEFQWHQAATVLPRPQNFQSRLRVEGTQYLKPVNSHKPAKWRLMFQHQVQWLSTASSPSNLSGPVPEPVPVRRYPVRVRKPPARLDLWTLKWH